MNGVVHWFVSPSQVKAKEVICQAVELVRELVSGMSNFLTYTEQVFNNWCESGRWFIHTFSIYTRKYSSIFYTCSVVIYVLYAGVWQPCMHLHMCIPLVILTNTLWKIKKMHVTSLVWILLCTCIWTCKEKDG